MPGVGSLHADRKWPHRGEPVTPADARLFVVDARFQYAIDRLQEVTAVGLDVETDQVRAQ